MATQTATKPTDERSILLTVAWIGTLLASVLPLIIWREFLSGQASQALWLRLGSLLALLALSFVWKTIRPLRGYFVLLLAIFGADELLRPLIANSALWQQWFGIEHTSLFWNSLGTQLLRLLMTFAPSVVLVVMGLKRRDYFLVKGQLDAPAEPVRWLGEKQPQPWTRYGRTFLIVFTFGAMGALATGSGLQTGRRNLSRKPRVGA